MVCNAMRATHTPGVGLILRSFGEIMRCLFRCFCLPDHHHHRDDVVTTTATATLPSSSSSNNKDHLLSRSLHSLLLSQTDNQSSPCAADTKVGTLDSASQHTQLKHEAKSLRKIQKNSEVKDLTSNDEHSESSWLPSTSIEKLHWEGKVDNSSTDPINVYDDLGKESGTPFSPENHVTDKFVYKSVQFELESDNAFLPSSKENTNPSKSPGNCNQLKRSPCPTPPKLSEEMQTPGTAYPIYSEKPVDGVKARVRSQYAYNVLNPVQNFSQLMALKEEDYSSDEQVDNQRGLLGQSKISITERSFVSRTGGEDVSGKEAVDANLSHWLKHSPPPSSDIVQKCMSASSGRSNSSRTSDIDRPILGTVAAHWNAEEPSHISPKWWDGNGIPNSTNKYTEDQKVSWHATTFEERLEKALSSEGIFSQGKLSSEPTELAKSEESDTAMSRLQASNHPESIVSF